MYTKDLDLYNSKIEKEASMPNVSSSEECMTSDKLDIWEDIEFDPVEVVNRGSLGPASDIW